MGDGQKHESITFFAVEPPKIMCDPEEMPCHGEPNPPERSLKDLQDDILVTKTIEMLWAKYDVDGNGYLDRNETKRFVVDSMKEMGMPTAGITDQLFEDTFREYDSDSSG